MGPKRLSSPGTLSTAKVPVIGSEMVGREDSSTPSLDSKIFIPSDGRECNKVFAKKKTARKTTS